MGRTCVWVLLLFLSCAAASASDAAPRFMAGSFPDLLAFHELLALSESAAPPEPVAGKLRQLLATPFVSNEAYYHGARPRRPMNTRVGPILRVAQWNINGGRQFELLRQALVDPEAFRAGLPDMDAGRLSAVDEELRALQFVDVLVLNEADSGVARTGYRDVARELAAALNMNLAYGVEFVEVDESQIAAGGDAAVDPERYRGLHGTAVLSRYPIEQASIRRLFSCHDWYAREKERLPRLELARRWGADVVFQETIRRQVRHGGRMVLRVDLVVPESPTGLVTVAATHLENKCAPGCRRRQMDEVLEFIGEVENPVVLAGDLNTTSRDSGVLSVRGEVMKRVRNPGFWASFAANWLANLSVPRAVAFVPNYFRAYRDPTVRHVPLLSPSHESAMFRRLRAFRFADGGRFDFGGGSGNTRNGRDGTLAASNERGTKGFKPTFSTRRHFAGLIGRLKLDWLLVKPAPSGAFTPHFGATLNQLNWSVPRGISDHSPILADLPLEKRGQPDLPDLNRSDQAVPSFDGEVFLGN